MDLFTAFGFAAFFAVGIVAGLLIGRKNKQHVEDTLKFIVEEYEKDIERIYAEYDELKAKFDKKKKPVADKVVK